MNYDLILDKVLKFLKWLLKLLNFLKQAKEAILIYSDGNINKAATFWKIVFLSVVLISALSPMLFINDQIKKVNRIEKKISNDIDLIISQCGFNSYISWITVDGINAEIRELRGCVNYDKDCIKQHLELDNKKCYNQIPFLDLNTIDLLNKSETGQVKVINNLEDWRKYDTIYQTLSCTNFPMDETGFTVVKDFKGQPIYVFTLFFTKNSVRNCKESWLILQGLGLKVKSYL